MKGNYYYYRNFSFPTRMCGRKIMPIKPLEIQGTYKNIDSCGWNGIASLNRCEQNPNILWQANNKPAVSYHSISHRKKETFGSLDQIRTYFGQFQFQFLMYGGVKKKKNIVEDPLVVLVILLTPQCFLPVYGELLDYAHWNIQKFNKPYKCHPVYVATINLKRF